MNLPWRGPSTSHIYLFILCGKWRSSRVRSNFSALVGFCFLPHILARLLACVPFHAFGLLPDPFHFLSAEALLVVQEFLPWTLRRLLFPALVTLQPLLFSELR